MYRQESKNLGVEPSFMDLKRQFSMDVVSVVKAYLNSTAFTSKKITDTPTDALSVVNRKYVNLNGPSANRPTSSIIGQFYFDTTLGQPVWWSGDTFVDASGNPA